MPLNKAIYMEAAMSTSVWRRLSDTLWRKTAALGRPEVGQTSATIGRANLGGFQRHPIGVRGHDAGSA
jgi:hypothetical protein